MNDARHVAPGAGKPADRATLVDIPRLMTEYYTRRPDASAPQQRVTFGTSGHRGSAFDGTFNEDHILAITQAICDYRRRAKIDAKTAWARPAGRPGSGSTACPRAWP